MARYASRENILNCDLPWNLGKRYKKHMSETIGNLIVKFRINKGWNQKELVRHVGTGQSIISDIERDEKPVSSQMAITLNRLLGIPIDILTGKSPVGSDTLKPVAAPLSPTPPVIRILDPYSFGEPELRAREMEYQAVPVYEAAVVGGPAEEVYSERAKGIAFIPVKALRGKDPKQIGCFEVKGESMMPVVRRGAVVCVDLSARPVRIGDGPAQAPRDSIWIVRKDGGLVIKYIRIKDGIIVLVSANSTEDVEVVNSPDAIVGRVIYIGQVV
jgi:transcriptional regulator with XRE-family HTH domain